VLQQRGEANVADYTAFKGLMQEQSPLFAALAGLENGDFPRVAYRAVYLVKTFGLPGAFQLYAWDPSNVLEICAYCACNSPMLVV